MKKSLLFAAALFTVNFAMAQNIANVDQTGWNNDNQISQTATPPTSSGSLADVEQINGNDVIANESDITQSNNSINPGNPKNEAHVFQNQFAWSGTDLKNGSDINQQGIGNGAVVDQRGSGNVSRILQTTDGVVEGGVFGVLNKAYTTQFGSKNDSDVKQYGGKNESTVNQNGDMNDANVNQVGLRNKSFVDQDNANNAANINQSGQDNFSNVVQN